MKAEELKKTVSDLETRLKKISNAVATERAKAEVYTVTLKQLAPKRQATEDAIKEAFDCTVEELPDVMVAELEAITTKTENLEKRLRVLEPEVVDDED